MKICKLILFSLFFIHLSVYGQEIILQENFENGIPEGWEVSSTVEKRKWYAKSYKNDYYINMSAFGGRGKPGYDVKSSLHTPLLDLKNKQCKLKFSFADAYQNGQPLEVYISNKDLNPIKKLDENYWKDLVNNSAKYDNIYEATEWIPLPQIHRPYKISFLYNSKRQNSIITTIIQLNELDVWCVDKPKEEIPDPTITE